MEVSSFNERFFMDKKIVKKAVLLILAFVMILSYIPATVNAEAGIPNDEIDTREVKHPYSIPAFTGELEISDEPPSFGPAPRDGNRESSNGGLILDKGAAEKYGIMSAPAAFGIDLLSDKLYKWTSVNVPGTYTQIGSVPTKLFAGDFMGSDYSKLYAISHADKKLYSINTTTGSSTLIATTTIPSTANLSGMAGGPGVMFGIMNDSPDGSSLCSDISTTSLVNINLNTGKVQKIGDLSKPECIIDITYVPSNGMLYGVDIVEDVLFKINPSNGKETLVGNLGYDTNYAQGMDYDEENEILYWAANGSVDQLRIIDINTGASAKIGDFQQGEVDSFAIAAGDGGTPPDIKTFRPNPDGYSFSNRSAVASAPVITLADFQHIFGNEAVCENIVDGRCIPNATASLILKELNRRNSEGGGVCLGISVTSLRFYAGLDSHTGYPNTYDLGFSAPVSVDWGQKLFASTAKRNIGFFHIFQNFEPFLSQLNESKKVLPSSTLEVLKSSLNGTVNEDYLMFFYNVFGKAGHAVVPYEVVDKGDGIFWVRVYDNNFPNDANRHIIIDVNQETWYYNLIWNGSKLTKNIGITPLSLYNERPICSWCDHTKAGELNYLTLMPEGFDEILIEDSLSRKLGFENGVYFDEIPGSFSLGSLGGLSENDQPNYYLNTDDTYTISFSGTQSKSLSEGSLATFGPGYGITIEDISLTGGSSDTLIIANDGSSVTYNSSTDQQPSIGMALDGENGSWLLEIRNLDMIAGEVSTISTDMATNSLEIESSEIHNSHYDLFIMGSGTDSMLMFYNKAISKLTGETHTIRFDQDGKDVTAILEIDKDGDGIADEVVVLENMVNKIYLPMIFK